MNLELRLRSVPCSDPDCATVLGWPEAHICEDCSEQLGIPTHDEQLELPVEVEPGEKAA